MDVIKWQLTAEIEIEERDDREMIQPEEIAAAIRKGMPDKILVTAINLHMMKAEDK